MAYRLALERDPGLRQRYHAGEAEQPPASPGEAPATMADPGHLIAMHAHQAGISIAVAMGQLPHLAAAYHRGELVEIRPPAETVVAFRAPLAGEVGETVLRRVPVFRAGSWNGRKYGPAELQSMVRAFAAEHFTVPLSLGHAAAPDAPAVGRVSRLWVEGGDTLLADFASVPPDVIEGIRSGKWLSLSCEVFLDLERNGVKYPAALRSIALLGAHPAGVDLPPLSAALPSGRA